MSELPFHYGPIPPPQANQRHGVVAVFQRGDQWLVIRRAAGLAAAGAVCFPGGAIQAGESQVQALLREVWEELGVRAIAGKLIWTSDTPWGVHLGWWTAHLPKQYILAPNPREVAEVFWEDAPTLIARADLLESNRHFFAAWQSGEIAPAAEL